VLNRKAKLPRTGIEQPFLYHRPKFSEVTREFERIATYNPMLAEEYEQKEAENGGQPHGNGSNKIIYDCLDNSPYYEKTNVAS